MEKCIQEAKKARQKAYAPYSKFKVGAAIKLKQDIYIHGANIENASYGLCNCAERSALFSLISLGYSKEDILSITVIADTIDFISPCGACRQVMAELLPVDAKIILTNLSGNTKVTSIKEILPFSFDLKDSNV